MLAKWHLAMPVLTACLGYFPAGGWAGWRTPRGVVRDWSFMGPRFEARGAPADGTDPRVATMAAVTAPILALSVTDDEFGTEAAIDRLLAYTGSARPSAAFAGFDGPGVDRPFRLLPRAFPRHALADRAGLAHARAVGAAAGDSHTL